MFCQNCGSELHDRASFCPRCGGEGRRACEEAIEAVPGAGTVAGADGSCSQCHAAACA
ncbi:MAG: zinc-ribbon domain-containing protein [Lachnospiraceae bacterium]|nr:zinc-ribbon domain-containing protein [Lachnospiraceae bacterium]